MHFQICFYFFRPTAYLIDAFVVWKGEIILAFSNIWKVFPDTAAKAEPTQD